MLLNDVNDQKGKDDLVIFLENTKLFTHECENMDLYITKRRAPTWIKPISMPLALISE
jgi:hypothetical protein